jgi:hypothetical protein
MPAFSYPSSAGGLANEGQAITNVIQSMHSRFGVAGAPLGSMTQLGIIAAGVAEALSGIGQQQMIDVRQFGQWQDGVNCTATIAAALAAAGTNTVGGTPYPFGVIMPPIPDPLGGVLISAGLNSAPINIPTGVQFMGSGWQTHLTIDPATVTVPGGNYHVFDCLGQHGKNFISNFQLDGNKANITSIGNVGMALLYAAGGGGDTTVNELFISNLYVHDWYAGPSSEGFGILYGGGSTRCIIVNCWAFNGQGSGISLSGTNIPSLGATTSETIVAFCHCYNNSFQGTTWFQTQYGTQVGCHCIGNTDAGTNIEQSANIQVIGGRARNNGRGGLQVLGISSQIMLNGVELTGNSASGGAQNGEIEIASGVDGVTTGFARSVFINDCLVTPTVAGVGHLNVQERGTNGSTGNLSSATADDSQNPIEGIFVSGPDVEKWNIYVKNSPFNNKYHPNGVVLRTGASGGAAPNQGGHPSTWTLTNITVSAAPTGAIGVNGKTFTQTVANVATSAVSVAAYVLKGTRQRQRVRYKIIDANSVYEFGNNGQVKVMRGPTFANDIGVWFEGEMIVSIPTGFANNNAQIVAATTTASVSALGVDYWTSELLPWLGGISSS